MVMDLGEKDYSILAGMTWLSEHNPLIDFNSRQLTFDRCSCPTFRMRA